MKTNKKGRQFLSLIIAATIAYSGTAVAKKVMDDNIYLNNKLTVSSEEEKELYDLLEKETGVVEEDNDSYLILTAAINNPNLSEEEKECIYKLSNIIEDNPYINKRKAYDSLRSLNILYTDRGDEFAEDIAGIYYPRKNTIKIFDEDEDQEVLMHELIHSLFDNDSLIKPPDYFTEGMTEILTNEYFDEDPFYEYESYEFEIAIVKLLTELVGEDKVLEAYSKSEFNIIEESLAELVGKSNSRKYLSTIKKIFEQLHEEGSVNQEYIDEFNKQTPLTDDNYALMYNRDIISLLSSEDPYQEYEKYIAKNGCYAKAYFSKKIREEKREKEKTFFKKYN